MMGNARNSAVRSIVSSVNAVKADVPYTKRGRTTIVALESNDHTYLRTADFSMVVRVPPVHIPRGEGIHTKRRLNPTKFAAEVIRRTDNPEVKAFYQSTRVDTGMRNTLLKHVLQASKDKRIHFTTCELGILFHMFFQLTQHKIRNMKSGELENFLMLTLGITDRQSLNGLIRATLVLANEKSAIGSQVTAFDFVLLLSILLRGTLREQAKLAFFMMDIDGDGLVRTEYELKVFFKNSFNLQLAAQNMDIDPEQPIRDSIRYLMTTINSENPSGFTVDEFIKVAEKNPDLIDGAMPTILPNLNNIAFQSIFVEINPTRAKLPLSAVRRRKAHSVAASYLN